MISSTQPSLPTPPAPTPGLVPEVVPPPRVADDDEDGDDEEEVVM